MRFRIVFNLGSGDRTAMVTAATRGEDVAVGPGRRQAAVSSALAALDECLSPHVSMMRRDCERLRWNVVNSGRHRVRVVVWTCSCRATVYELCTAGGRAFIRRTVQAEPRAVVCETAWGSPEEAWENWAALLSGRVR
jgi:hypothetical protein